MKKVVIIMGSLSDEPVCREAANALEELGVPHAVRVCSAHRTPVALRDIVFGAEKADAGAFICIAGMAAHLAGAVAALSVLPVVGVPAASGGLGGLDALLSTAQMPPGVPVAAVAVNGGRNAALLCAQMLAIGDGALRQALKAARAGMAQKITEQDAALQARLSD